MGNLFAKCISSGSGDDSRSAAHGYAAGDDVVPAQRREGHWPTPHPEEIVNTIVAVGGTEGGTESVSGDEDGAIKLCSWAKGTEGVVEGWKQPCAVNRLSHAKVGAKELFASGGRDGAVRVWRRGHPTPMNTLKGHELTVNGLAMCPEAPEKICSGSRDWTVRVWDADAGSQVATVKVEWNVVSFMRWIKGSDCVLQASEDLQLRVWDVRSMARPSEIIKSAHNNVMTCCDVSDDGNTLLSCSNGFDGAGCELKVWDRRKGELLCDLRGHTQTVTGCAFLPASLSPSPSSQSIVSSSQDSTVRTWDYTQNRCVDNISIDSQHRVTSIAVSPKTARIFTASFSGALGSWVIGKGGSLSLVSEANSGGSSLLSSGVTPQ